MTTIRKRSWVGPRGDERTAWQVDYRDGAGKRRSKQFARKKEAEAWLTGAAFEVSQGVHTPDSESVTVAKAIENWLAAREADKIEPATLRSYESTSRLHITPFLGKVRLSRLTRPMVEEYKDRLLASGRTKARAGRAIRYLSMALTEAERRGQVAQNVALRVKVIRSSRDATEKQIPTPEELRALVDAADDVTRPFVMTAMLTGLRASELRGLMWEDVDLQAETLSVRQRADERNRIGPPKSRAGRRTIPLSPRLISELRAWKLRCRPSLLKLVFPSPTGQIWSYHNLMNRVFWPLQVKAGVTVPIIDPADGLPVWDAEGRETPDAKYSLHALRHGAASLWIRQGIDLKRLKAWMGHATVQTTIDTYGHLMADQIGDSALVANAERVLLG